MNNQNYPILTGATSCIVPSGKLANKAETGLTIVAKGVDSLDSPLTDGMNVYLKVKHA